MPDTRGYDLPARRMISQDDRQAVEKPNVPRSRYFGTWTAKKTFDAGLLIPFLVEEILPGDHMRYNVTAYLRMSTPLFPLFDNQRVDTFFFFVPNRLLWDNWRRLMGQQDTPSSPPPTSYSVPQLQSPAGGFALHSLGDHFGLPVAGAGTVDPAAVLSVNALPFRAYRLIFHSWFRDQDLVDAGVPTLTGDGPDAASSYPVRRRAKFHDRFTAARPWPQKFTAPTINIGGNAPVFGIGVDAGGTTGAALGIKETPSVASGGTGSRTYNNPYVGGFAVDAIAANGVPQVFADLSSATGISINTLRQAWLTQQFLERAARGGTRYVESIWDNFGVRSPDFRLQRPEYCGGGSSPLVITPVAQTAPTAGVPLGALGAAATSAGAHRASYAATEHGWLIGLLSVRTELSYQQGVHPMWDRRTQVDHYFPSFAFLGEAAITRRQLYCTGVPASDNTVFGYQERWQEYRVRESEVTGQFRSGITGTLDMWHLSQRFGSAPVLNESFIQDAPDMARVLAAGSLAANQQYLADILIERDATRPLPTYSTPLALGRF